MILGLTPARGGSKEIPRKNLKLLCGKPLIAWTIEAAQQSLLIDEYIVSTEDPEIAETAEKWGARVLWRPEELSEDHTPTLPVLQQVLNEIQTDILVLLQATSPIRNLDLIDNCITRFLETQADSLATGFTCKFVEYGTNQCSPRQQLEGFFYDDGNVYVMKSELIRDGDRYGERMERVVLDREQSVEIDEEFDFWLAEKVLEKRLTT